jgi:uncharacterized protein DUF1570
MRLAVLLIACLVLTDLAPAQLKKERLPELGLPTFYRPRHFDIIPLQPGEPYQVLFMRERPAEERGRGAERRHLRPELYVVRIEKKAAFTGPDAKKDRPKVTSLDTWMKSEWGEWTSEHLGPGKRDRNYLAHTYKLTPPKPKKKSKVIPAAGYAYVWETPHYLFCLVGRCAEPDYEEFSELFEQVGKKMKVAEPEVSERSTKKLDRLYRGSNLPQIPYRIRVREAMVDGWKAEDTQHYIVIYNTTDQPMVRKVLRDLETIRESYVELFPPAKMVDAVSTVRICADRDEYIAYGGAPRSAGYWNSRLEELVLYDAEKQEKGKRADDSDTFVVLYHEAFHQYIHYSTGELPPHSWFNEGYGDYFSGAQIKNGKVRKIGVNPWRVGLVQAMLSDDSRYIVMDPVPWSKIIKFTQGQYYTQGQFKYAQGWSMIYFLNTSPKVAARPEWNKILPTYFETLKTEYGGALAKLGEDPAPEKKAGAGQTAREAALEAAFKDVNLDEIDEAWQEYTLTLKDPRKK